MKISELQIAIKILPINEEKYPDLKANVTLNFGGLFSIAGFSVRKGIYESDLEHKGAYYFIGTPGNSRAGGKVFKFVTLLEPKFKKELEAAIFREFQMALIPVIESDNESIVL